jgi:hypothetical protein
MGAPRKFPPKDAADIIERLAAEGHTIIGIAKQLGAGRVLFKRWCEEDDMLQEAFESGRDSHRQALVALIMRDAALSGRAANSNAMFLLKTMHGFRENDSSSTKVSVGVTATPNVMIVRDYGDDETWERKAIEQQRNLVLNAANPPKLIEASITHVSDAESQAPAWMPSHLVTVTREIAQPVEASNDASSWRGNT